MRTIQYDTENLRGIFFKKKIMTLDHIKEAMGTTVKMTAFRKLKMLDYRSSYSDAGKYYTLDEIATYNEHGLWSYKEIYFSANGSLINTIKYLIDSSEKGYFASELKTLLKIRVQEPLLKLYNTKKIYRRQIVGEFLYLSIRKWRVQFEKRKQLIEVNKQEKDLFFLDGFDSPEVRNCLELFLSTLNEKQRRLYVGFESMKLGRGGDIIISKITGINVKTISRGRIELLSHDITPERIRKEGAGRPPFKKN